MLNNGPWPCSVMTTAVHCSHSNVASTFYIGDTHQKVNLIHYGNTNQVISTSAPVPYILSPSGLLFSWELTNSPANQLSALPFSILVWRITQV